jgi:HEPN domain-containing protein
MQRNNDLFFIVKSWIRKAENDLKNASNTIKMKDDCPTDTICFHAQQCVEKYLKALLVLHGIDFPKTPEIKKLISLLSIPGRLDFSQEEQIKLSYYATVTRYPGDYDEMTLAEAEQAVKIAKRVRNQIRKLLPKEVLKKV